MHFEVRAFFLNFEEDIFKIEVRGRSLKSQQGCLPLKILYWAS